MIIYVRTIRKFMGGGGDGLSSLVFFFFVNISLVQTLTTKDCKGLSLYEFFLEKCINIFGLLGVHEVFSILFL